MHVMIAAIGSLGDVLPVLGFGRALKAKGHSVAIMTPGSFEAEVKEAGLEYLEICDRETYERTRSAGEQMFAQGKGLKSLDREIHDLYLSLPERVYRLIEQNYVPGETVVASLPLSSCGATRLAEEKLGTPSVHMWINLLEFHLLPRVLPVRSIDDWAKNALLRLAARPMRRKIDELRRQLGLPKTRSFMKFWIYEQKLNIGLFPAWFVPWFHGQLPKTVLTGFPLYQGAQTQDVSDELKRFLDNGEPPVVFMNASWREGLDEYFDTSVAACESLGLRGVLLSAKAPDYTPRSDAVITASFTPLQALLPHAKAIVHHGGLGTMAGGMAAGIPQIVIPFAYDHPENAGYLKRFGVGARLSAKHYKRDLTPTLKRLLASKETADNCRKMAARFEGAPDYGEAIARLEAVLEESRRGGIAGDAVRLTS